ncbi:MAG: hypothetical protein K2X27_18485 [Candidatus Obscuribacterales bacterium]|nr:hypothetical protein [Candidatus Obscuribacterales bacterium]
MNILSLNLFGLLKKRSSRLKALLAKKEASLKEPVLDWSVADTSTYTVVDTVLGGRKIDLLTSVNMGGKHLHHEREGNKSGKARWHVNKNEQVYRPKDLKLDPQLEFVYEELGLSNSIEPSELTPPKQMS